MNKNIENCYECGHHSDKCKNKDSDKYDVFVEDINNCNLYGTLNNDELARYKAFPEV